MARLRAPRGLERELSGDGGAGGDRHRYHAGGAPSPRNPPPPRPSTHACGRNKRCAGSSRPWSAHSRTSSSRDMASSRRRSLFVVLFKFTDALAGAMTGPFVDRSRFHAQRIRDHHQGRWLSRNADRRICGRLCGARVSARRRACGSAASCRRSQISRSPGRRWSATIIAWLTFAITVENFTSAIGTVIFVGLPVGAVQKSAAHRDAVRAAHRARGGRAHLSVGRRRLYRGCDRLGVVLRDLRARGDPGLAAARLAAARAGISSDCKRRHQIR